MKQTISILVENQAGVLNRITGLFSRRAFNIDSLAVGVIDDPTISRITIIVDSGNSVVEQVEKQLIKLVDVIKVRTLEENNLIGRELMILKVNANNKTRQDIITICEIMGAKVDDISPAPHDHGASTPRAAGHLPVHDAPLLHPEVACTGVIAVQKGGGKILRMQKAECRNAEWTVFLRNAFHSEKFAQNVPNFAEYLQKWRVSSIHSAFCTLHSAFFGGMNVKVRATQAILECLLEQEVDTVFGYPGGTILNIYDELYRYQDRIHHILTAHEQGAAHAADGYARSTGKVGVCFATSGPGATNLTTGIATAYMDSSPVVFITCNVTEETLGRDAFQEVDITGIAMPITKATFLVRDPKTIPDVMRQAFAVAATGRPGPVLIDFLKNVTAPSVEIDYEFIPWTQNRETNSSIGSLKASPPRPEEPEPDRQDVDKLLEMIRQSERPFLICGGGVVRGRATSSSGSLPRSWTPRWPSPSWAGAAFRGPIPSPPA